MSELVNFLSTQNHNAIISVSRLYPFDRLLCNKTTQYLDQFISLNLKYVIKINMQKKRISIVQILEQF